MRTILIILLMISFLGCSPVEPYRKFAGTSTLTLQTYEPRFGQSFDKEYKAIFDRVIEVLEKNFKAYVMVKDYYEGRILALEFDQVFNCIDTTEVGIFINQGEDSRITVEVASFNSALAEFIANKLFFAISSPELFDQQEKTKAEAEAKAKEKARQKEEVKDAQNSTTTPR